MKYSEEIVNAINDHLENAEMRSVESLCQKG